MTKLIVFDMDGTLAESKQPMDEEMSNLLNELLKTKKVAVISGGKYGQYEKQFLGSLNQKANLHNLYLFPTCSTSFYRYSKNKWNCIYSLDLTKEEKEKILNAFEKTFKETNYKHPETLYGQVLEDRQTQITMSALGQNAPVELKKEWDPNQEKRRKLKSALDKYLPDFEVRMGGTTSIDVSRKGIDKAYGINKIEEILRIKKEDMIFIGDALYEGGNDYPVIGTGVKCIKINSPEDTKREIRKILEQF